MKAYRLLSEDDTAAFCHKVSEALSQGWELYGSPAYAFDAARGKMRCAQAVIRDDAAARAPEMTRGQP